VSFHIEFDLKRNLRGNFVTGLVVCPWVWSFRKPWFDHLEGLAIG